MLQILVSFCLKLSSILYKEETELCISMNYAKVHHQVTKTHLRT